MIDLFTKFWKIYSNCYIYATNACHQERFQKKTLSGEEFQPFPPFWAILGIIIIFLKNPEELILTTFFQLQFWKNNNE